MKVEVPDFVGRLDLDAFYNWITALEDYFDYQSVKITVDQYTERFHELTIRSKLAEIDAQVLARYLKGLKPDIRREMLSVHLYNPSGNSCHYYNTDLGNFHFPALTSSKPFVDTPKRATTSDSRRKGKAFGE
ncbi:hypothetical protein ACOSQ4_027783 [Xanthoceras sorbifolium]